MAGCRWSVGRPATNNRGHSTSEVDRPDFGSESVAPNSVEVRMAVVRKVEVRTVEVRTVEIRMKEMQVLRVGQNSADRQELRRTDSDASIVPRDFLRTV